MRDVSISCGTCLCTELLTIQATACSRSNKLKCASFLHSLSISDASSRRLLRPSSSCRASSSSSSPAASLKHKPNKRKRRNPPAKASNSQKLISHIHKNIQHKSTTRSKSKQTKILTNLQTNITSKIQNQPTLKPISEIVTSSKFQSKVIDQLTSFQKTAQEYILPDSLKYSRPTHEQRIRNSVVMDQKWWFWNIMIGLFPAVLVALVCEWHREEADSYYERMNGMATKKQKNNENDVASGSVTQDNSAGNLFQDEKGKSVLDKTLEALKLALFGIPPQEIIMNENGSHGDEEKSSSSSTSSQIVPHQQSDMTYDEEQKNVRVLEKDQTIHELLKRIKVLENKLGVENNNQDQYYLESQRRQEQLEQEQSIVPQSNIRRRIEGRKGKNLFEMESIPNETSESPSKALLATRGKDDNINPQGNIWEIMLWQLVDEKVNNLYRKSLDTLGLSSKERDTSEAQGKPLPKNVTSTVENKHDVQPEEEEVNLVINKDTSHQKGDDINRKSIDSQLEINNSFQEESQSKQRSNILSKIRSLVAKVTTRKDQ